MPEQTQCSRCLYTVQHPLGIVLDDEGVCSGCRVHEEKDQLDWNERWSRLKEIVNPYVSKTGTSYDCIVPVTGANDSYFIVHVVKNRLGLNPLLVTYNKYFNTPLGIRNLANLRIKFNCDILVQNVNINSVRKIIRTTLRELGSMYWNSIAGQTVFPVQTAVRYKIPLIIWGAHQGTEQVGMFSHLHEVEMTRRYRKDHDLMGHEPEDFLNIFNTLTEEDVWQYQYPDDSHLASVGVRGIYLSNYVRWDPTAQHRQMVELYNYMPAKFLRTFDVYDHTDCFNFMGVHDYIKFIKHGYTKVTDHACREIRHGRLTRAQAQKIVRFFEEQPVAHIETFCEWLKIDRAALEFILNQHRNRYFWNEVSPGNWLNRGGRQGILSNPLEYVDTSFSSSTDLPVWDYDQPERYVVYGRGYPD